MTSTAGLVLAGGRSSRMGTAKAGLDWHGSSLLRRVTGLVARGVDGYVVVVRSPGQVLPPLPASVEVVEDPVEGRGPLQGLAVGLAALAGRADAAFLCSTDVPFLQPAYVRAVLAGLGGHDVALPHLHGFRQPLAAAYAVRLAAVAAELAEQGLGAPRALLDRCDVLRLDASALLADPALAAADPGLRSVQGTNDRAAYDTAVAEPAPEVVVERYGVLAAGASRGPRTVRAWTVGAAAEAVGLLLDRHVLAAVNGDQTSRDPHVPLVAGDAVAFLSADAGG